MEIEFLGRGSAFNTQELNNSAFIKEGIKLFLIDCGSNIFKKILDSKLLNEIAELYIFITHMHLDHIGSLTTLILYCNIKHNIIPKIISVNDEYMKDIETFINLTGADKDNYILIDKEEVKFEVFKKMNFTKVRHAPDLISYTIEFETEKGLVVYTGDISDSGYIKKIFSGGIQLDKIYLDITINENSIVHFSLKNAIEIIPEHNREKVYCMHIESEYAIKQIEKAGFKVVETI